MKQRVISAAVLIITVTACMALSPYTRILLFTVAAVLSIRELKGVFLKLDIRCADWVLYLYILGTAALAAFSLTAEVPAVYHAAWLFLAAFLAMLAGIISKDVRGPGAMATAGIVLYPLLPYVTVALIAVSDGWLSVFVTACLATWICDSFALFGGKAFGKHKVAPYVSPNKTVEGCITGALSSLLAGVASYYILLAAGHASAAMWIYMLVALIASTFGQVGDLAASLLKRMVGLKDYSNLIPGHGGMMDRADSLLFSVPVAWFCLYLAGAL